MTEARTWVRLGLVALAAPQLVTGLWAMLDSSGWYDDFPGFGASWVSADGPYNAHLATDAGAGFLATGVILVLAALWGHRREVNLAVIGYLCFAVPHLTYHLRNEAPGLTDSENLQSVSGLVVGAILPFALLWGNRAEAPVPAAVS